jgi:hypothetical protein
MSYHVPRFLAELLRARSPSGYPCLTFLQVTAAL